MEPAPPRKSSCTTGLPPPGIQSPSPASLLVQETRGRISVQTGKCYCVWERICPRPPAYPGRTSHPARSCLKNLHYLSIHKDATMRWNNFRRVSQISEEMREKPGRGGPGRGQAPPVPCTIGSAKSARVGYGRGLPPPWPFGHHRYFLVLLALSLALAFLFIVTPGHARAAGAVPSLQVNAGFGTRYRDENWIPVQVTLSNTGADFNGTLSLSASLPPFLAQDNTVPASSYRLPIALPNGTQKQITLTIPLYYDVQSVVVNLLDGNGNVVVSQTAKLNPLLPGEVFVGILSDATAGFGPLNAAPLPVQGGAVALDFLNAGSLPSIPALLKNFDVLVLDNFTTGSLSVVQLG